MAGTRKFFSDSVYGSIALTKLEADIVSTPVFQRLHNVKQLGFAHLVFPGANYSRFAHSVGACHNASRLLEAIEANTDKKFDERDVQACRLAALLHDVGHYPFSHATEHKIEDYYAAKKMLQADEGGVRAGDAGLGGETLRSDDALHFDHEQVGRKIIELDEGLKEVFKNHGLSPDAVKDIFSKQDPNNNFIHVVSSDLDCDRLDYLSRTAHNTGLPYGKVDVDYIISQATLDEDGVYCFAEKALRAADHLLISRESLNNSLF